MSDRGDEHDKAPGTPGDSGEATTPYRTPQQSEAILDVDQEGPSLRELQQRFDVLAELGRGGMGIVYKARDRETGEIVALKLLRPEIASDPDLVDRFKTELKLARRITHKNVCRTHDLHRFGNTVVIAMEYVEGESLRSVLARYGPVSLRKTTEWAQQVCAALTEAHAQGVVHRDLKPENIVIDIRGCAKVTDFGIARSVEATRATTGVIVGTPAYMSPEQADGKPGDARSDVYSLGLILYEMFTGQPGLRAETPVALLLKQMRETPAPPREVEPTIPVHIEKAILKCLNKDPAKRFQSVKALEEALMGGTEAPAPVAAVELPLRLAAGQRSDLLLVLLATIGFVVLALTTMVVFPETNAPFSIANRSAFDRGVKLVRDYGWTPKGTAYLYASELGGEERVYWYLADKWGAAKAREWLRTEGDLALLGAVWRKDNAFLAYCFFDSNGALRVIDLPVSDLATSSRRPTLEGARALAEQKIKEAFGADVTRLESAGEGTESAEAQMGYYFSWVDRRPSGITEDYRADIYQRPTTLTHLTSAPQGYQMPRPYYAWEFPRSVLVLLAFVLFLTKGVYSLVDKREGMLCVALGLLCGLQVGASLFPRAVNAIWFTVLDGVFGVMTFGLFLLISAYYVPKRWPAAALTYKRLFHQHPVNQATALALTRGSLLGLTVCSGYAGLLWLAVSLKGACPGILFANDPRVLGSSVPGLASLALELWQAVGAVAQVCLVLALARRRISSPIVLSALAGGIWVAIMQDVYFDALPRNIILMSLTFLAVVAFAAVFFAYDFLTMLVTAFTFYLWMGNWPMTKVFERVGNWQFWLPLVIWGALLAASTFVAYRPLWASIGRHIAEAFE